MPHSVNRGWTDGEPNAVDVEGLRRQRLNRLRDELLRADCDACVLFDPINIRYATDSTNMSVWCLHNPARYCFVPVQGPVVLFEFHNCEHLSAGLSTIDEVRNARPWFFLTSGPRVEEHARRWAADIADLLPAGRRRRLALDRCDPAGVYALLRLGIDLFDGQAVIERARSVKLPGEIACMRTAIDVAEGGLQRIRDNVQPGVSEQWLWSLLHQTNIRRGGEWIETRLLSSGERTNPWMQECSDRLIQPGDMVCVDTDLIGPRGYCADISRAFVAGQPSQVQRHLYRLAREQLAHNLDLLKPGAGFREIAERAWPIPSRFRANRYSCILHGVGLCDEYPFVVHDDAFDAQGYDGVLQAGMTLSVESYIGESGGREGVKLEQQVVITDGGFELLSSYPFDLALCGAQV